MQSVSFRIWTRITVSVSYDDNHYTKGTSLLSLMVIRREIANLLDCGLEQKTLQIFSHYYYSSNEIRFEDKSILWEVKYFNC